MELSEEIKKAAMQILAKHGKADHKFVYRIYKETGLKSPETVINAVCGYFNTTLDKIIQRKQTDELVKQRQVLCYLLFHQTELDHNAISKIINRDRVTVFYSINKIKESMQYYEDSFSEIYFLTGIIETS